MQPGLIHIYTGTGKGKTTAAVGLCVRALGYNLKVLFITFNKKPEKFGYKELIGLRTLGATVISFTEGHPHCDTSVDLNQLHIDTKNGLQEVKARLNEDCYDLLVLDEVLISLRDNFLNEDLLMDFIKSKPTGLELVLTGRGATEKLINLADYVSDVQCISHPYSRGITSRKGIEC